MSSSFSAASGERVIADLLGGWADALRVDPSSAGAARPLRALAVKGGAR